MAGTISDGPILDEMRVFSAVAARRSFTRAAAALAMPRATVSRRVQELEARLGLRLLHRTTRRVSLTEAGAAFQERCQDVEAAVAEAEEAVLRFGAAPRGTLRVTAPFTLAQGWLVPALPAFLDRYPEVRVWLTLKNEAEDLVGKGVDVAISPWPVADSRHVARVLGVVDSGLYASPAYLARRGRPRRPEELQGHAGLLFTGGGTARREWALSREGRELTVPMAVAFAANDMTALRAMARAGLGILRDVPVSIVRELAEGQLVRVLPAWVGDRVEVRALYASRAGLPPKVRVFLDFLSEAARGAFRR